MGTLSKKTREFPRHSNHTFVSHWENRGGSTVTPLIVETINGDERDLARHAILKNRGALECPNVLPTSARHKKTDVT